LIPVPFGKKLFYPETPAVSILITAIAAYIFAYVYFARRKFLRDDL
jgi:ABC-2 type transport system permease protein